MTPTADDPVEILLGKLQRVKRSTNTRWMALCPAHDDSTASLSVSRGADGRALVKCFANCRAEDIVAAVGLTMGDLFVQDTARDDVIASYDYRDEQGQLVYQAVRRFPKRFVQRRPDGAGGWLYELGSTPRYPYRLPELLAADPARAVFIVEGEKDVDRLSLYRLVATTNSGGAGVGKWTDAHSEYLRGRNCILIPDNDKVGRDHMVSVANSLLGVAASVRVVQLSGLPEHGDISDWLDQGHKIEELRQLVLHAKEWQEGDTLPEPSEPAPTESDISPQKARWEPVLLSEMSVPPERNDWLWRGYVAPAMITLLTGLWKSGKSTLLGYVLQAFDEGAAEFAGQSVVGCKTLVLSEESARHWVSRRDELGIKGKSVGVLCKPFTTNPDSAQWNALVQATAELVVRDGYGLVIFDSLPNLWAVRNENDNAEVKGAITALNLLTAVGAAVLLVGHHSKSNQAEFKATRGAGALMGFVDVIMEYTRLMPDDEEDTRRVLRATGRFDETPHEVVLQYFPGFGYEVLGTRSEAARAERHDALWDVLPTMPPGATVAQLHDAWPRENKPSKGVLGSDLRFLAREGVEVLCEGRGTPQDPYRYWRSAVNRQWQKGA